MVTTFVKCKEDHEYEKYIRFFITNRNLMTLSYPMDLILYTLSSQMREGHIILGLDGNRNPISILAYFYGDPEDGHREEDNLIIQVAILKKEYQKTATFLQGFQSFIDEVIQAGHPVTKVTFYADSSSTYLQRLYSKFAKRMGKRQTPIGDLDIYGTGFEDLANFIQSLHRKS